MKSFIEVIKEADDVQARLKFIQDPKSPTKSIAGFLRNPDPTIKNAAQEELKRRRDAGDQEAGSSIQPPKDPSMHSATTQVGGDSAQKETKTKEVEPNNIAPSKKGDTGRQILNNLSKGKTISGDSPNAIELNPKYIIRADGIKEEKAPGKTVVFSFGRMNPPTIGHEKLVRVIEREAKLVGGTPRLYLSRTEGDTKNPLPYSKKNKFAKLAFPIVKDTPANMMPSGFIGLLKHLEDQFNDVVIVVGSDRLANIKKLAERYNGTEYKYNTIKVVSAGERDPDEEGAAGMSASKMRQAVKDGKMAAFKAGLPSRLKGVAKTIFDELSKSLQEEFELDEAVLTTAQRLKRRQVMRRSKGRIRAGQKRSIRRKANMKQISRRSRRIAIRLIRKRILRGKKYSNLSLSSRQAVDRIVARRKVAIGRIAKRIEPKLRRSEASRKSGGGYKSISLSSQPKKKLREGMSRDNLIQVVTEMFNQIAEEVRIPLSGLEMATLRRKCNESNNSFQTLRTVFDRGVASWHTGLREDSTPQQWGFARVNSFIANGKTRFTADRDLLEADDTKKHETIAIIKDPDTPSKEIVGRLNSDDQQIRDAADQELKKRRDKGDKEAGAALDDRDQESADTSAAQPAEPAQPQTAQQDQAAEMLPQQPAVLRNPQTTAALANALADKIAPPSTPQTSAPLANAKADTLVPQPARETPLSTQEIEARASRAPIKKVEKAVEAGTSNQDFDAEDLDKERLPPRGVVEKYSSPETFALLETKEQKISAWDEINDAKSDLSAQLYALDSSDPDDAEIVKKLKKEYGINAIKDIKKEIEDQLAKLEASHEALGRVKQDPLTDNIINERRTEYKITDKRVVKDGTHIKLLTEANDIVSTLLTGAIESNPDYSVAGNLGSSFNEVSSGTGHSFAVENNLDLTNMDDHMKMACHVFNSNLENGKIPNGSKLDLLGKKAKSSLPDGVKSKNVSDFGARLKKHCGESVDQLNKAQLLTLFVATEMAKSKTISTQRDMKKLGWNAADLQSTTLAGARIEKQHLIKSLKEYKKNGATYVVTGGNPPRHLDIDQAITYAQNGGGGQNSSDTTILIHNNKTGEIYFRQTSDKSNPQDQTGNTTVNAKHNRMKSMLEANRLAGVITEQQYKESIARVEKAQADLSESIKTIISSKSGFVGNIHAYLSSGDKNAVEATRKAFEELGKAGKDKKKYYNTVLAHYDKLAKQGVPGFKPNATENEKFKKVIAHINDNPGLDSRDKLAPSADLMKAIQNLSKEKNWQTKDKPNFGDSAADKATAEAIFRSEELLEESLNEVHPDMGSELVEREQLERCHLLPAVDGALTPSGNPQSSGAFDIALGWCSPTIEDWRECTGLTNMADLHKNTRVKKTVISKTGGYGSRMVQVNNKDVVQDITSDKNPEELGRGVVVDKVRTRGDIKTWSSVQTLEKNVTDCLSKKYPQTDYSDGSKNESFLSFGEFLSEGPLSPIPKTAKPNLFHGNYGGKGNRGGEPVDKLDQAFQKHDTGYHYTPDSKKRLKHDKSLVKATSSIVKDKSQPIKTRVKAGMATALFKTKLALKKNVKEQTITPKYTGDENSWYLDASGQKVRVFSQADLKYPENVDGFLKNPTRQKDIGKMMSMTDFLKTQPEKKK